MLVREIESLAHAFRLVSTAQLLGDRDVDRREPKTLGKQLHVRASACVGTRPAALPALRHAPPFPVSPSAAGSCAAGCVVASLPSFIGSSDSRDEF